MKWAAIGDSFTYLNNHLDETGYRVSKGYLTRIQERIPELELTIGNFFRIPVETVRIIS